MEYARMDRDAIGGVNMILPADSADNAAILQQGRGHTKFYMGTPKWGRKEWIGKLYPRGTRDAQFLPEYTKHYNAIEFNTTHYKAYPKEETEKWAKRADNPSFKFCPKVWDQISHYSGFSQTDQLTAEFLEGLQGFGTNLGPLFLQVSEKYKPKQRHKLFAYLRSLPRELQFFLEVRHPDWFSDKAIRQELFDTLRSLKIGAVINDTLAHRDVVHTELSIPKTFIRFSCEGDHPSDNNRIDDWVNRLKEWQDKGLEECYFFVHVLKDCLSPEVTKYVSEQFNKVCNAGLPPINLLTFC